MSDNFEDLFRQTGLDPKLHDMAEFEDAHARLCALMRRLDDPERPHGAQPLSVFDPKRPL